MACIKLKVNGFWYWYKKTNFFKGRKYHENQPFNIQQTTNFLKDWALKSYLDVFCVLYIIRLLKKTKGNWNKRKNQQVQAENFVLES